MRIRYKNRTNGLLGRWRSALGPGLMFTPVEIDFGVDQAGNTISETYATGGIVLPDVAWRFVGLSRPAQLAGLAPMRYGENIAATQQGVAMIYTAETGKLFLAKTEATNGELANATDLAGIRIVALAIGG